MLTWVAVEIGCLDLSCQIGTCQRLYLGLGVLLADWQVWDSLMGLRPHPIGHAKTSQHLRKAAMAKLRQSTVSLHG